MTPRLRFKAPIQHPLVEYPDDAAGPVRQDSPRTGERRWKDSRPSSRTAAVILERALQFEIDHYGDFDASVRLRCWNRLLPGRGTVWVRFETKPVAKAMEVSDQQPPEMGMEYECTRLITSTGRTSLLPARCWDEVTWIARRVICA